MFEVILFWILLFAIPLIGLRVIKRALRGYTQGYVSGWGKEEGRYHYDREQDPFMFHTCIALYFIFGSLAIGFFLLIVLRAFMQVFFA